MTRTTRPLRQSTRHESVVALGPLLSSVNAQVSDKTGTNRGNLRATAKAGVSAMNGGPEGTVRTLDAAIQSLDADFATYSAHPTQAMMIRPHGLTVHDVVFHPNGSCLL